MYFLGNPSSVHLAAWRRLYDLVGIDIAKLFTVHRPGAWSGAVERVHLLHKIPSYIVLGLRLRLSNHAPLHAHGASGYGLSAWVSGKPYVVTVYGSELLGRRSALYRAMVRTVLQRAAGVTVTSEETKRVADQRVRPDATPVFHFHTGVDTEHLATIPARTSPRRSVSPVRILSLRNTAPVYRTREIIKAVDEARRAGLNATLKVMIGNGDRAYFDALRAQYTGGWITWVGEAQDHDAMLQVIADADVCISFPETDQLSTSLLEAIYFDTTLVTADLPHYGPLFDVARDYGKLFRVASVDQLCPQLLAACSAAAGGVAAAGGGADLIRTHFDYRASAASLRDLLGALNG